MNKILVGMTSDIPDGKMVHLMIDKKKDILVVKIEGNYYAKVMSVLMKGQDFMKAVSMAGN